MTHPKQNTQAPTPNTAPRTLDAQIEQVKREFKKRKLGQLAQAKQEAEQKKRAASSNKALFVSLSVGERMQMLTPMPRQYYDNPSRRQMMPRTDSNQCRVLAKVIACMFPTRTGGAV